jgi:MoaA/NifB/PqqE/SkfB family radical SAM enzyme
MNSIIDESCRFRPPRKGRLVLWELTRFCNLACKHCCTGSSPAVSRKDDLPTDAALAALHQLGAAEVAELYLTGGEPLARQDFVELLLAAGETEGLALYVATNGTFIRDRHVKAFETASVRAITISVDGHDATSHDAIRGPGAFAKTELGIRRCVQAGLAVRLSHMITPTNYESIPRFCEFAVRVGVRSVALHTIIPAGTAVHSPRLVLRSPMTQAIQDAIKAAAASYQGTLEIQHGLEGSGNPRHCIAGQQLLHISPTGDVSPCSWMYKLDPAFRLGNLREEPLLDCLRKLDAVVGKYAGRPGCPIPVLAESARQRLQGGASPAPMSR